MGISMHPVTSFDESDSTAILSRVLQSKRTIKTFFKENDRTPNYDGTFELVNTKFIPQKQFIVQIKKAENLTKSVSGKHTGKYVFKLETAFLHYVKAKVTESPAIYFVVDICTKNIFWIYLSDEFLMNLDFEKNKSGEIRYAFSEEQMLKDIDIFTEQITAISKARNDFFINKSKEEISKLQDALDYINTLMENDLQIIKEHMFPNLWRFGIRCSNSPEFKILFDDKEMSSNNTVMYALYPQTKGVADTGLKEYNNDQNNLFNTFDMLGKKDPIVYTKETLSKIIKTFFENGVPIKCLPNIVLFEQLNIFSTEMRKIYDFKENEGAIPVDDMNRCVMLLFKYTEHILADTLTDKTEIYIKSSFARNYSLKRRTSFDPISIYKSPEIQPLFKTFSGKYSADIRFSPEVFRFINAKYIKYFLMIQELIDRGVKDIKRVWDYDYTDLIKLNKTDFMNKIDSICSEWFEKLPALYDETFELMFDRNKYKYKKRIECKNEYNDTVYRDYPFFTSIIYRFSQESPLSIRLNNELSDDDRVDMIKKEIESIGTGAYYHQLIFNKTIFYDSISYLLYKGICNGLDIKAEDLTINNVRVKLF